MERCLNIVGARLPPQILHKSEDTRQVRQVLLQVNHRRVGAPPAQTEPLKDPLRPGSTRGHVKFLRFGFDLSVAALLSSEGGER
jgi:hypothetical protein